MRSHLTPNAYYFLLALYSGGGIWYSIDDDEPYLITNGYIVHDETTHDAVLTPKGVALFDTTTWVDTKFEELWNLFPQKTPRGRVLRALSLGAKNASTAKAVFKREVKTEQAASNVIRSLKLELVDRRNTGSLEYMNNFLAWLRGNMWDMYASDVSSDVDIDTSESSSFDVL